MKTKKHQQQNRKKKKSPTVAISFLKEAVQITEIQVPNGGKASRKKKRRVKVILISNDFYQ